MNTSSSQIKVALCQMDVRLGAVAENSEAGLASLTRACEKGADLVVLPELWSCGFDGPNMVDHAGKTPDILASVAQIAGKYNTAVAGSLPEFFGDRIYNTLFVTDPEGRTVSAYRKIHLFPLLGEADWFAAGTKPVTTRSPGVPAGLMICYDLRFPELCRHLAVSGARAVLISAQWPAERIAHWDVLLAARAIENQVFVVAVNRCGTDPNLAYNGHSRIISPDGSILADAGESACECMGTIDVAGIDALRSRFSTVDERVPEAYKT